jgi:nitrite reductase/ring-hydroxylating ferredoxin subunit
MQSRMALALVVLATVAIVAVGCASGGTEATGDAGGAGGTGGVVSPTWIGAEAIQIDGDSVSISASEVESGKMVHFRLTGSQGDSMAFMAYEVAGETHVRANLCPPCRSVGFSLAGDILVCDSCHTQFEAETGEGINGACVAYPKAAVAHTISGGKITMGVGDLVTASLDTGKPGWP